jgi:very-short-patch-repair endonuclease
VRGEKLRQKARILRKNMTDAERAIWQSVRNRQLSGFKFRRQRPIGPYIVDFVCAEKKIIIEIDGGQHALNTEHDDKRSEFLRNEGYRVLRFWNSDVLKEKNAVLEEILLNLKGSPSPRPSPP